MAVFHQRVRQAWSLLFSSLFLIFAASHSFGENTINRQHANNIRDAISSTHDSWHRDLQACASVPSNNVEAICDCFNENSNSTSVGDCTCSRFDTLDTKVTCSFRTDCRADANATASCFVGTVEQIFNPQLESQTVDTCVRFPLSDNPSAVTCIRTFPVAPGNYRELTQCVVLYTPTGTDKRLCSSCSVCPGTNIGGGSSGETERAQISFDCCNLQTDLQQSCNEVTESGVGIPFFDPIIEAGTCVSGATVWWWCSATIVMMTITSTVLWI